MRKILMFVEDFAHEEILKAVIFRLAQEYKIEITINSRSATGGHGRVLLELRTFVGRLEQEPGDFPDLLVVATDANCNRYAKRKKTIKETLPAAILDFTVCAIPDPHIERWLLIDSSAFKAVMGKGCAAPPAKCERVLYKRLLIEAIREAGLTPLVGGIEHARDIVKHMDFGYLERTDNSFGRFLSEMRDKFKEWSRLGLDV